MVVSCCAYNCAERFEKGNGITFHSFPEDENRRKEWINALKMKNFKFTPWKRLCSKHFLREDYVRQFGKLSLIKTAIPTVFDFPEHLKKKKPLIVSRKRRWQEIYKNIDENIHENGVSKVSSKATAETTKIAFENDANTGVEDLAIMEMNPVSETTCRACLKKKKKLYGIFNGAYMGLSIADIIGKIINPAEFEIKEEDGFSSYFCSPCRTILLNFYQWESEVKKNQDLLMKIRKGPVEEKKLDSSIGEQNESSDNTLEPSNDATIINNESVEDKLIITPDDETIFLIITSDDSDCKSEYLEKDEEVVFEPSPVSEVEDNNDSDYLIMPEQDVENRSTSQTSKQKLNKSLDKQVLHCEVCNLKFEDRPSHQEHMRNHRKYICEQCGKSYSKKTHLDEHREIHLPFKRYICNYCGKSFRLRSSFYSHRRIHMKPRSHICEICGRAFNTNATMKTHISLIHLKDRRYVCELCNQAFPLQGTLSKHIRRRHKEREKIFKCSECPMAYWENATLKRHMFMKHSQERQRLPCDFCGKDYSTKSILKRHSCKGVKLE